MKHVQFIKTVHPNSHRSFYVWAICSSLLIVASIFVMAYISIAQWRLMSSLAEEKNKLMYHESEYTAITGRKKGMVETKAACLQKINVVNHHLFGIKKQVTLIQEITDLCIKQAVILRSFKVKKDKIVLYCLIQDKNQNKQDQNIKQQDQNQQDRHQVIAFVDGLSAITLLKNVELISIQKKGDSFAITIHADFK